VQYKVDDFDDLGRHRAMAQDMAWLEKHGKNLVLDKTRKPYPYSIRVHLMLTRTLFQVWKLIPNLWRKSSFRNGLDSDMRWKCNPSRISPRWWSWFGHIGKVVELRATMTVDWRFCQKNRVRTLQLTANMLRPPPLIIASAACEGSQTLTGAWRHHHR
jgi:hypothetical protein